MAPSAAAAAPPLFGTTEFRAAVAGCPAEVAAALRQIDQERSTYRACAVSSAACPSRGVSGLAVDDQDPDRSPSD